MDSARFPRMPRQRLFEQDTPTAVEEGEGEGFEEVGLDDDEKKQNAQQRQDQQQSQPQPHKKRGFFARFADHDQDSGAVSPVASPSPTTTSRFSLLPNRKRAQSGQGAELSAMERPRTDNQDFAREMSDVSVQA